MKRQLTLTVSYDHPHSQDSFILDLVCRAIAENVDNRAAVTTVTEARCPKLASRVKVCIDSDEPIDSGFLLDLIEECVEDRLKIAATVTDVTEKYFKILLDK